MKKVLYTATVASHICQFHLPYMQMLKEMGYEVHVAARDNLAEKNGLKLEYTDKFFDIQFRRSPFSPKNLGARSQLKKIIDREGYELIICNTPVGGIMTRLAASGARRRGTRVIYVAHGFHFYRGGPKKSWLIYYPIEKIFAPKCDVLVTINEEDFLLTKEKFNVRAARIHGVGVSAQRYRPASDEERARGRARLGYKEDEFIALVVGELLQNKNQIMAIKAVELVAKENKKIKLLIAGNGSNRESLEKYVKEHNLEENVEFLGYCTHIEDYQKIVDVGISCSIREGLGLNVIEAMLSGNPVIATKNRGHNELIRNEENGYLVDVGDFETMASIIVSMIDGECHLQKMKANATEFVQKYELESVKREFSEIFESVLK